MGAAMNEAEQVVIYADGACKGNPGPGGWGALLTWNGHERELFGGEPATTNNRMELLAVIRALEALSRSTQVAVYTDSQYVHKGITEWLLEQSRQVVKPTRTELKELLLTYRAKLKLVEQKLKK